MLEIKRAKALCNLIRCTSCFIYLKGIDIQLYLVAAVHRLQKTRTHSFFCGSTMKPHVSKLSNSIDYIFNLARASFMLIPFKEYYAIENKKFNSVTLNKATRFHMLLKFRDSGTRMFWVDFIHKLRRRQGCFFLKLKQLNICSMLSSSIKSESSKSQREDCSISIQLQLQNPCCF